MKNPYSDDEMLRKAYLKGFEDGKRAGRKIADNFMRAMEKEKMNKPVREDNKKIIRDVLPSLYQDEDK